MDDLVACGEFTQWSEQPNPHFIPLLITDNKRVALFTVHLSLSMQWSRCGHGHVVVMMCTNLKCVAWHLISSVCTVTSVLTNPLMLSETLSTSARTRPHDIPRHGRCSCSFTRQHDRRYRRMVQKEVRLSSCLATLFLNMKLTLTDILYRHCLCPSTEMAL